jgi:hypothetical protein
MIWLVAFGAIVLDTNRNDESALGTDTAEPIIVPLLHCPRHRVSLLITYTRCARHAALGTLRTSRKTLCNTVCNMHCVLLAVHDWHHGTDILMHACMHVSNAWWLDVKCVERCVSLDASDRGQGGGLSGHQQLVASQPRRFMNQCNCTTDRPSRLQLMLTYGWFTSGAVRGFS